MVAGAISIFLLIATAIQVIALYQVVVWKRERRNLPKPRKTIKVSILKPMRGIEPNLETNLHSFFNLNNTVPFELLICIKNPDDPAIAVVQKLMDLHPQVDVKLYIATPDMGFNPKVSNIHTAWKNTESDLLLISDSNVRVEPDYLEMLLAERETGAGLVTQAMYCTDAANIGAHLDAVQANTFYLKATAFLSFFNVAVVVGKCMLFSKADFEALGGLFSVRNYLAEDSVIADIMKDAGHTIRVAPQLLRQTSVQTNFKSYWNRHVRWARLRKNQEPVGYAIEPLLFDTFWPLILMAVTRNPAYLTLAWSCLGIQILANLYYHWTFQDEGAWRSLRWFWLKDLAVPAIWLAGLFSNKVLWRGHTLYLRFGGKLRKRRRSWIQIMKRYQKVQKVPASFYKALISTR